ncbi:hypothetical protein QE152_g32247 [Popillia japonica]|uniref:Uncharacterized protein n=1 Tax=Popillia japonica TaxID=7064 RepID=A0AAW1IZN6_POPJA
MKIMLQSRTNTTACIQGHTEDKQKIVNKFMYLEAEISRRCYKNEEILRKAGRIPKKPLNTRMEAAEPKRRSKERLEEAFDEDCLEAEAGKKLAKHRLNQRGGQKNDWKKRLTRTAWKQKLGKS